MNHATIIRIIAGTAATIVVVILASWALGAFSGLSSAGAFALIIGITLSLSLGIGLMTLIFWSARSERDDAAYGAVLSEPARKPE